MLWSGYKYLTFKIFIAHSLSIQAFHNNNNNNNNNSNIIIIIIV